MTSLGTELGLLVSFPQILVGTKEVKVKVENMKVKVEMYHEWELHIRDTKIKPV